MFKELLELVEIRTKIASVFPFLIASLYAIVVFKSFNLLNMIVFFIAMLCFDMATTVMNNLMDYVKAKNDVYRQEENIIGQSSLTVKQALQIFLGLLGVATVLGIVLVWRTNVLLLFVGALCFLIGIFYTFGPIPISRMPLGEVLSGVTMGFGIFWIVIFLNVAPNQLAAMGMVDDTVVLNFHLWNNFKVFLLALPLVCTIANIMLSNNLCDLETDITNHRYTLVYYIGKTRALVLYQVLYGLAFLAILLAVVLQVAPWPILFTIAVAYPVYRHSERFKQVQDKKTTFIFAIKNMVMIHSVQLLLLLVSAIIFR